MLLYYILSVVFGIGVGMALAGQLCQAHAQDLELRLATANGNYERLCAIIRGEDPEPTPVYKPRIPHTDTDPIREGMRRIADGLGGGNDA